MPLLNDVMIGFCIFLHCTWEKPWNVHRRFCIAGVCVWQWLITCMVKVSSAMGYIWRATATIYIKMLFYELNWIHSSFAITASLSEPELWFQKWCTLFASVIMRADEEQIKLFNERPGNWHEQLHSYMWHTLLISQNLKINMESRTESSA